MINNKAFLGINLDLLENPKYTQLDTRASILYSLYADRSSASLHNAQLGNTAFCDAKGVFIRFSNELAAKIIRVSEKTIGKFRKQLVELGLIEVVRDGLKGYKIYVKEVQPTPNNVELLMPWKNHTITIKRACSDWTIAAQLELAKNIAKTTDINVKVKSTTTNQKKVPTSLSQPSLSQGIDNNIDLIDNTPARVRENKSNSHNQYHSLPNKIKESFNKVFGFISNQVAIELHSLIDTSNADMVNYAILHSQDRKITSPVKYLKSIISNALSKGQKCAKDMQDFYENNIRGLKKPRRFMTKEQVEKLCKQDECDIAKSNPAAYQRWLELKIRANQKRTMPRPEIPVYSLGE